jgi:hypothetical protein
MPARVRAVQAREAEAQEAAQKQQRMHAQMQLTCEKLRRSSTAAWSSFPTSPSRTRWPWRGWGRTTRRWAAAAPSPGARRRDRGRRRALPHADGHPAGPAEGGAPVRLFRPLRG